MDLPRGKRIKSVNVKEFLKTCRELTDDFRGVFRIFMRADGKLYVGNILIDRKFITACSLRNEDDKIEVFRENALNEIKDKLPIATGDLDVYSFDYTNMLLVIDKNKHTILPTKIELDEFRKKLDEEWIKKERELERLEEERKRREEEYRKHMEELRKRLEEERKRRAEEKRRREEAKRKAEEERKRREEEERRKEEEERKRFRSQMKKFKSQGYNTSSLEKLLDKDLVSVRKGFEEFEKKIKRLKVLEKRFNALDVTGFDAEANAIKQIMKDVEKIDKINEGITKLRKKIEKRKKRDVEKKREKGERRKKKEEKRRISKKEAFARIIRELELEVGDIKGSAIITKNGLLVASKLPRDVDTETFAAMSAAMYGAAETAILEIKGGHMFRVYTETDNATLVAVNAGPTAIVVALVRPGANLGLVLSGIKKTTMEVRRLMR